MAVKHTPTKVVHHVEKSGITGCGVDTKKNPEHWSPSHDRINCEKNGCKH